MVDFFKKNWFLGCLHDNGFRGIKKDRDLNCCRLSMVHDYLYGHTPRDKKVTFKGILDNEALLKVLESIDLLFVKLEYGNSITAESANGRSLFWEKELLFESPSEKAIKILENKSFFGVDYMIILDRDDYTYTLFKKDLDN